MNADIEEDILKRIEELDKLWIEGQREQFSGAQLGTAGKLTDEEFMTFFAQKAAMQPLWVFSLQFVDGGEEWLRRYDRIQRQRMMGGPQWLQTGTR
jgi:hypothetical protein